MPAIRVALLLLLPAALQDGAAADADGWAWTGVFALRAGEAYTWSAARGPDGRYADAALRLVVVGPGAPSAEAEAQRLFGAAWSDAAAGSTLALEGSTSFRLRFDEEHWLSLFHLRPSVSGSYTFFAEHPPSEFESGFHFLKDASGRDVQPTGEEAMAEAADAAPAMNGLGTAVVGAAVSAVPGLAMVAVVGPAIARVSPAIFSVLNSFSAGVIFAAAVFLLLPEALHMASAAHTESEAAAAWGVAILLGWLTGVVSHHLGHHAQGGAAHAHVHDREEPGKADDVESRSGGSGAAAPPGLLRSMSRRVSADERPVDLTVAIAVIFGDFWHNLVDGMIIGFSAKTCDAGAFWGVVGATLAHEAPQEVADFIVLMTAGGLHWGWATFFNAASAFPATIAGSVIAYQVDVSETWKGVLLAFGAGVYLFVAATELAPSLLGVSGNVALASAVRLLAFAVGAACIGLVLVDHTHCAPVVVPGAGHAH